jgi:hypothetical protein
MTMLSTILRTVVILALLLSSSAFATSLVAVTTDTEAYLGIDSKAQGSDLPRCKLIEAHGFAVGMSGHIGDLATKFDAATHIADVLRISADFKSTIENLVLDIQTPLARSIAWGKLNAPAEYAAKYDGKKVLELVVISVIEGKPRIAVLEWRAQGGVVVAEEPKYLGINQSIVVGTHRAVEEYQERHPEWTSLPALSIIRTFLEIEAKQEPEMVGHPLSIVRIDSASTKWISLGTCEAGGHR